MMHSLDGPVSGLVQKEGRACPAFDEIQAAEHKEAATASFWMSGQPVDIRTAGSGFPDCPWKFPFSIQTGTERYRRCPDPCGIPSLSCFWPRCCPGKGVPELPLPENRNTAGAGGETLPCVPGGYHPGKTSGRPERTGESAEAPPSRNRRQCPAGCWAGSVPGEEDPGSGRRQDKDSRTAERRSAMPPGGPAPPVLPPV